MKLRVLSLVLAVVCLTGCTALLERDYSATEPHSSKFWESEAAGTLRAENRQDIVNDLLLLIGRHTEAATIRLYNFTDEVSVADILADSIIEIKQETPMGAYAVEFITTSTQEQRGYYEISVQIGYRRSVEQMQAVVNATSPEAVYTLLETALNENKTELAVRVSYWGLDGQEKVEGAMEQLRADRSLTEDDKPWLVNYYPESGPVGLVEFLLDPSEELLAQLPPKETLPEEGEVTEAPIADEETEGEVIAEGSEDLPPESSEGEEEKLSEEKEKN